MYCRLLGSDIQEKKVHLSFDRAFFKKITPYDAFTGCIRVSGYDIIMLGAYQENRHVRKR